MSNSLAPVVRRGTSFHESPDSEAFQDFEDVTLIQPQFGGGVDH